jgi:hypothetical protein
MNKWLSLHEYALFNIIKKSALINTDTGNTSCMKVSIVLCTFQGEEQQPADLDQCSHDRTKMPAAGSIMLKGCHRAPVGYGVWLVPMATRPTFVRFFPEYAARPVLTEKDLSGKERHTGKKDCILPGQKSLPLEP